MEVERVQTHIRQVWRQALAFVLFVSAITVNSALAVPPIKQGSPVQRAPSVVDGVLIVAPVSKTYSWNLDGGLSVSVGRFDTFSSDLSSIADGNEADGTPNWSPRLPSPEKAHSAAELLHHMLLAAAADNSTLGSFISGTLWSAFEPEDAVRIQVQEVVVRFEHARLEDIIEDAPIQATVAYILEGESFSSIEGMLPYLNEVVNLEGGIPPVTPEEQDQWRRDDPALSPERYREIDDAMRRILIDQPIKLKKGPVEITVPVRAPADIIIKNPELLEFALIESAKSLARYISERASDWSFYACQGLEALIEFWGPTGEGILEGIRDWWRDTRDGAQGLCDEYFR